jgi:hypothetical protein
MGLRTLRGMPRSLCMTQSTDHPPLADALIIGDLLTPAADVRRPKGVALN